MDYWDEDWALIGKAAVFGMSLYLAYKIGESVARSSRRVAIPVSVRKSDGAAEVNRICRDVYNS